MGLESTTLVAACTRQLHATRRLERSDEWSKAGCKVLKSGLPLQSWALWNNALCLQRPQTDCKSQTRKANLSDWRPATQPL